MASVQVLRKQEHLEAGKRKLEEFRRKKAAEKATKATSVSQTRASDGALPEKQHSETDHVRLTDSSGAGTSDAVSEGHLELPGIFANNAKKESDIALRSDFISSNKTNGKTSVLGNSNNVSSSVLESSYMDYEKYGGDTAFLSSDEPKGADDKYQQRKDDDVFLSQVGSGIRSNDFLAPQISSIQETSHNSSHSNYPEKDLTHGIFGNSAVFSSEMLPKDAVSLSQQEKLSYIGRGDNNLTSPPYQEYVSSTPSATDYVFGGRQKNAVSPDMGDKKSRGSVVHIANVNTLSQWNSDLKHIDYNSDSRSSSNYAPPSPSTVGRRSRPSFLDSIQISKGPSFSPLPFGEANADSSGPMSYPMDGFGSSFSQRSANSSVTSGDRVDLFNHVKEDKQDFYSREQNEDFAALEQHIEDLTQEKFSLQRALEASRALAENLASENSALTDSFNQQGSVVNQLKSDLENLQEKIKAHLVELEAVRIEYTNAQLECDAADQRAKILASELIELEEKSLRVRSNELKLERQLESCEAEISSYRKKMSSLKKDRQDLQSIVDALKEEKKLLQSKLWNASARGKSPETNKISYNCKDVSTSTHDLVNSAEINTTIDSSNSENLGTSLLGDDAPGSVFPNENIPLNLEGLLVAISSDQLRTIHNINTLMAELAQEKYQLMQALSAESSQSSKLLELNKELTRKLEAQTQRLELLTSQSMANDNIPSRQPDPRTVHENPTYADEGDEVVERVLGWIMKLFPGGPSSRRRTSKHL